MKYLIITAFFLVSCGPSIQEIEENGYPEDNIHTFVYQNCEYVCFGPVGHHSYTHKGNCKNPIHLK